MSRFQNCNKVVGLGVVVFGLFVFVLGFFLYTCLFEDCGKEVQESGKEVQNSTALFLLKAPDKFRCTNRIEFF